MDVEAHALPDIDFGARQSLANGIGVRKAPRAIFLGIRGANHNFARLSFWAPGSDGFEVDAFSNSVDSFEIERRRLQDGRHRRQFRERHLQILALNSVSVHLDDSGIVANRAF